MAELDSNSNSSGKQRSMVTDPGTMQRTEAVGQDMVVRLVLSFRNICIITAALPMVTLTLCFISAYIYQSTEIHETHCKVYNIIPSISAITGISPQRYFWRICIALHIGPRIAIAIVYWNYYQTLWTKYLSDGANADGRRARRLINVVFALNIIEIGSLCGVTYVSNRENYPLHEKVFITFMVCSLCHMLATIKLLGTVYTHKMPRPHETYSLRWKKILFTLSMASTLGLILFFLKHRLLCHDMAFSWFAFCEYVIATANMGFHWTCTLDFPIDDFIIASNTEAIRHTYNAQFLVVAPSNIRNKEVNIINNKSNSTSHLTVTTDSSQTISSIQCSNMRKQPKVDAKKGD